MSTNEPLCRDQLQQEQDAFEARYPQLRQTYIGRYIAIAFGNVIDSDADQRALLICVHQEHPDSTIGIFPVSDEA